MFDVGFFELLLIGTVALLVLGPERLPRAARSLGLWLRRARAAWYAVRADLERELADDELRRSLAATRAELADARRLLDASGREIAAGSTVGPTASAQDAVARGGPQEPAASGSPDGAEPARRPDGGTSA
ncbi:MAG: hypothetical protein KatS3mg126_0861 [Lysobacteraceae bacterium]|nr:MAG: hypothetical protein KatS3mg126_0861 [Xanthomonadaceae bacterium]